MDKKVLISQLADLLEVDNIQENDSLEKFDSWDSLTMLSIIALASEKYGRVLSNSDLRNAKTVGGLLKLFS
jgi:acyl carrier protein